MNHIAPVTHPQEPHPRHTGVGAWLRRLNTVGTRLRTVCGVMAPSLRHVP